jgi:uncharacterized protein DUF4199
MNKTVWTFGLISGAILSAMMLLTIPFVDSIGSDRGEIIGYTTMVLASLLIYVGVRSYRDNVAGGTIGFGRALAVGSLIVAVSSVCYVVTWEIMFFKLNPEYAERFRTTAIEKAKASGESPAAIQKQIQDIERFQTLYRNPAFNAAVTFLEPLPVGLIIAFVTAGVLSRKRRGSESELAASVGRT